MLCKWIDWFLYDKYLLHKRIRQSCYGSFLRFLSKKSLDVKIGFCNIFGTGRKIIETVKIFSTFLWKEKPVTFEVSILKLIRLFTRKVCKMFANKHTEAIVKVPYCLEKILYRRILTMEILRMENIEGVYIFRVFIFIYAKTYKETFKYVLVYF